MTVDLLAFGAHPDDLELSCGGWLALAARGGQAVGLVDLTAGELATNGTVEERAREAAAAAEVLGVRFRENLGLPDGGIDDTEAAQLAAVVARLRRHRPTLVLAPALEARHPDHAAAGRLLQRAVFFAGVGGYRPDLGERHRPLRLVGYPERHEVGADFVVDVGSVYDTKRAAIACHASQVGDGRPTLVNDPVGRDAFEVRDRYWGASIGVAYGEPYLLGTPLPLSDPLAHFREHPATPVWVPRR